MGTTDAVLTLDIKPQMFPCLVLEQEQNQRIVQPHGQDLGFLDHYISPQPHIHWGKAFLASLSGEVAQIGRNCPQDFGSYHSSSWRGRVLVGFM